MVRITRQHAEGCRLQERNEFNERVDAWLWESELILGGMFSFENPHYLHIQKKRYLLSTVYLVANEPLSGSFLPIA